MEKALIATDLDDTLIGDDKAMRSLLAELSKLRDKGDIKLVYSTGRSLVRYKQLENEKGLPKPDALVTAVGSEIYWNGENQDAFWPIMANWPRDEIIGELTRYEELRPQPESEQRPFKLSYYLEPNHAVLEAVTENLKEFNSDAIYSQDIFLDVMPMGINKGTALIYLANHWAINTRDIIACGDSGNDIAMLKAGKSVVVGNARPELLDWAKQNAGQYDIYMAHKSHAAGVEEGLKHFVGNLF
jgi:sucrose-6F-phosphate phosphohydrolase